jgi:acyl transferase domain-containing protein/NAD(P)H-dependent flavin oxidoreductase YrpB (nitropropane dioxygenase family)
MFRFPSLSASRSPRNKDLPALDVIGLTPFERPDARLVIALARAGALGVLDLGRDPNAAREALAKVDRAKVPFGVRLSEGVALDAAALPARCLLVITSSSDDLDKVGDRLAFAQVTSIADARRAIAAGASGLVLKGSESGGPVGEETSFVLLQHAFAGLKSPPPIFVQGGAGLHTSAACIAGGAAGVVLDAQLALVRESTLPEAVKAAVRAMDGSETVVVHGVRVFSRPDLAIARNKDSVARASIVANLGGDSLEKLYLPAGQDAAFARSLADKYVTASGVVHAIRAAIAEHLDAARASAPLAPGSKLAASHSVRFPIVQGPMTRVSDRAAFADAVSAAGALPFLALSLLRGDEVRTLMKQTRDALGERPFGVGILGFVPEDLRDEQLAVLREIPPAAAIIAGGRPSQARPLDEQGTITYLHVPSPGLLDLFLKDGARRFVFEGRECGGHVGPRTSFTLWELQIERLLAHPEPSALSVLFAGGIHDARSAAMVAAMAGTLAAGGASVGVLLGTAYLFTEEAVTSGAIQPGFQSAALACEHTVLLETAPGHATRCVDTPYVAAFTEEKKKLESSGKTPEQVWEELEQLNVGRLRIAAKGLTRKGAEVVTVGPEEQAREGMFMIGQVAALRREVVTMEALHRDVAEGATTLLAHAPEEGAEDDVKPADVAIVGLACIYADAPNARAFWSNVVAGRNAVTEVPRERWDSAIYYDASSMNGDKTPSKWGAFLPEVPFDPLAYGIPPKSLASIEPVQLLALEVAKRALDDAGYAKKPFDRERTSVIFGAEAGTDLSAAYGLRALWPAVAGPMPQALDEHLPTLTEDSFPGVLANVIAGRIANRLDLGGVNYTVDAACAASLAALELAVKELTNNTSDMVLCGGADLHNSINDYLLFASVHALSPSGACRTFAADADGIVLGEGVACVVLKRLADAERDGDRVYAVIKGVAGGSDGKSLGLTAPRKEGQMRALARAYRAADVSPAQVGLVEAHGTGTVVGDRTELATLTEVFAAAGAPVGTVALGSVKSQIGHTKCSAGMAGLIKAALALHHRVIPPTLHIKRTNPAYDAATSPFRFFDQARPWVGEERHAGVSAFGFGGTNFHAVLASYEGADAPISGVDGWTAELFLFRGADRQAAIAQIDRVERHLERDGSLTLADLARSVSERRRRDDGRVQIAIVATSLEDLREKLAKARALAGDPAARSVDRGIVLSHDRGHGKLALLFSGQGSQRPGMLADLFVAFPKLGRYLSLGERVRSRIYPPLACTPEERSAQLAALTDTRVAQPALGVVEMALGSVLRSLGVKADMVGGHSYGELAALCFAGAIEETELCELSEARADAILDSAGTDPGTMAAVSARPGEVAPSLVGLDRVVIANHNAPEQTVISGPTDAVAEAVRRLEARGLAARGIPVAAAFHSPVLEGAPARFAERLATAKLHAPQISVYSNASAEPYQASGDEVRTKLAEHVAVPVRFVDEIEAMHRDGARVFLEVGPGRVLTGLVSRILEGREHVAVACDQSGETGLKALLLALAEIAAAGVSFDVTPLFAGRTARKIDLDAPPVAWPAASAWMVNGHLARPLVGDLPKGALRPLPPGKPLVTVGAAIAAMDLPVGDREATVLEYLRTTREIIEAQRQVMLGYLGEAPPPAITTTGEVARHSVPPLPSFSPPGSPSSARSRPNSMPPMSIRAPASRRSAPSSIAPVSLAPRAAKLPSETVEWMRDLSNAAPAAAAPPTASQAPAASLKDTLLAIVSERTGYPVDMLDLDLNLEAELSIDSIKRIEILGTLGQKLGFLSASGGKDKTIEKLATLKTLRAIIDWLEARAANEGDAAKPSVANGVNGANGANGTHKADSPPGTLRPNEVAIEPPPSAIRFARGVRRFVVSASDAPLHGVGIEVTGKTIAIAKDPAGVGEHVAMLLAARGAIVKTLDESATDDVSNAFGVIDLSGYAPDAPPREDPIKALFDRALGAFNAGAAFVIAATHAGLPATAEHTRPRAGIAGLLKTLAKEAPSMTTRAIGLDPSESVTSLAEHVVAEITRGDEHVEVSYVDGKRRAMLAVEAARVTTATTAPRVDPRLGSDAVILATGGARGITATIACAIAKRFGCKLELVGRSPLPVGEEDADLAAAPDLMAVRRAIIARGIREPAAIEVLAHKTIAAREIRATLSAITTAGGSVAYHALDVRDARAFGGLIDSIYEKHGRIDGVLHGAGVLDDRLLSGKTRASFDRVVDTKLASARVIAEKIRADVSFVTFFASVSGAFGNRGQIDYSAANDELDKLARWLAPRIKGRAVALDWGPWRGGGMVSVELEREYAKRGVGLIDPEDGVDAFLGELGEASAEAQVILMNAAPSAFTAVHEGAHESHDGPSAAVDG